MPDLKDVLKLLNNQINNNELSAAISATDENVEISEDNFEKIKEDVGSLMTYKAALNNPKILETHVERIISPDNYDEDGNPIEESNLHKKLKGRMFKKVERSLAKFGNQVGLDLKNKTFDDQISELNNNVDLFKSSEITEETRNQISELNNQLKREKEKIVSLKTDYDKKLDDLKIDSILINELSGYNLDKAYQKPAVRDGIFKHAIAKAKEVAGFQVNGDNSLKITQKDNPEMDLYDNNEVVDKVEKLLLPHVQDYLQVTPDPNQKKVAPEQGQTVPAANDRSLASMMKSAPAM